MRNSVQNEVERLSHTIIIWANDYQVARNGVADPLIARTFTAPEIDGHIELFFPFALQCDPFFVIATQCIAQE